jgi:hypothetical protein
LLLEAGRAPEAAGAYEQSLQRTANRTPSVKGLERAKSQGAKPTTAERQR